MEFKNLKTVVQIGANRGYDDLTDIIKKNKDSISKFIAVEPMKLHNKSLKECYGDISGFVIDNRVITINENELAIDFYYTTDMHPKYEIASLYRSHIKKHMKQGSIPKGEIKSIRVDCITINNLFKSYKLKDIDLLSIDAEGCDLKILKSINFDIFNIDCIIYEHVHVDNKKAVDYLKNNGYSVDVGWGQCDWSCVAKKK